MFTCKVMSASFGIPWTIAHQSPLSMVFLRQEYWSRFPFPSPGHLLDPRIEPVSLALEGRFFTTEPPGKSMYTVCYVLCLLPQLCQTLCHPMTCSPPDSTAHGDSPSKITGIGCHDFFKAFPNLEIKPRSPALQGNSLPTEPPKFPDLQLRFCYTTGLLLLSQQTSQLHPYKLRFIIWIYQNFLYFLLLTCHHYFN